ncbi:TPA: hypothetical protein ACH3X2_006820 [Trebouxia sp. C0005]
MPRSHSGPPAAVSGNAYTQCPIKTAHCASAQEMGAAALAELRAYKLGKRRWSYNQCELVLHQDDACGPGNILAAVGAVYRKESDLEVLCRDPRCQVVYEVQLENGAIVMVVLYLVYAVPSNQCCQTDILPQQRSQADMHDDYQWNLVTRSECSKGCQGPLLHTVRRYGSLGCRFTGPFTQVQTDSCLVKKKQNRYMYCAIDEAGSHVGSKSFRLVVGVYSQTGKDLLGSACSQPIRVMANNDIPHGAAHIPLVVHVRKNWAGWQTGKSAVVSRCLWPSSHAPHDSTEEVASSEPFLQSKPSQLLDSNNMQPSSLLPSQEFPRAPAPEQAHQLYGGTGLTVDQPASAGFTGVDVGEGTQLPGLYGQQQNDLQADLLDGLIQSDQPLLLDMENLKSSEETAFAAPLLADCVRGKTSCLQLLDEMDSSGGLGVPQECFVSSGSCELMHLSSTVFVKTTSDDGHDLGSFVPMMPSAASGSINHIAGSTCRGGRMSQLTLPVTLCQQSPDSSSSATGGVGRFRSAPQLGKRKGTIGWCSYKGNVQTCQLHKAQADFRKSLRRGFLSPRAAQGSSSGEEHVRQSEAGGGHPASSQAKDVCQTSDVEVQASQIQAERYKADMLAKQLQTCRQEAAWLRSRVCQLQQNKHARATAAARAAALPPSHKDERQALQQRQHFHANVFPPFAATSGKLLSCQPRDPTPVLPTPVLQPLPQPPLRHFKSLQVAPEAQPATLLLVDVLTATNVAGINTPQDQQHKEGTSDVQQMQEIVCGLTFEDTLNSGHTGTWGVRTRAITANSAGKLDRVERLILELKGPIGTAGKLKLQLMDTAANTGAGQPIAHASVDLDILQWKDSQTYQADVPLATDQGKEGGKLLLRYTLQQQFQDVKSLHTDAWSEHSSSAGQRALQIGDDSKWVVIASSGVQRAAANVGAGGMLKKNLPDKHKHRSAAVVLPVCMGDEGVALKSSFKDGVKNEVLRSLCQLSKILQQGKVAAVDCASIPQWHGT